MPKYYCGTCKTFLAREEQRRNYENKTTPGPIIVTQLNLPNVPPLALGRNLSTTTSYLVVRCVHCGSDAVSVPTEEENLAAKKLAELRLKQNRFALIAIAGMILFFTILIYFRLSYG